VHETLIRERMSAFVRKFRPDVVFTHFPEPNWRAPPSCNGFCKDGMAQWDDLGFHPDHKRAGLHAFDALYGGGSSASNDHLFPELSDAGGLHGWKTPELYFFALTRDQPMTHYVPLTEPLLETKAKALAMHKSQFPTDPIDGLRWVGRQVGAAAVSGAKSSSEAPMAEGFQGWF
jgi:LmbE family N-acetylglucosaminyl deacetylase